MEKDWTYITKGRQKRHQASPGREAIKKGEVYNTQRKRLINELNKIDKTLKAAKHIAMYRTKIARNSSRHGMKGN